MEKLIRKLRNAHTPAGLWAIVWLAAQLVRWGVPFIDCQVRSEHLVRMGAVEVPRREFLRRLRPLVAAAGPEAWRVDDDLDPGWRPAAQAPPGTDRAPGGETR